MNNLGLTNVEIKKYINKEDDDFKNNFVGVFPSDYVNRFTQFHVLMEQKQSPSIIVIVNTERAGEEGEYCWSFLDLDPPKQLHFYSIVLDLLVSKISLYKTIRKL